MEDLRNALVGTCNPSMGAQEVRPFYSTRLCNRAMEDNVLAILSVVIGDGIHGRGIWFETDASVRAVRAGKPLWHDVEDRHALFGHADEFHRFFYPARFYDDYIQRIHVFL